MPDLIAVAGSIDRLTKKMPDKEELLTAIIAAGMFANPENDVLGAQSIISNAKNAVELMKQL